MEEVNKKKKLLAQRCDEYFAALIHTSHKFRTFSIHFSVRMRRGSKICLLFWVRNA